jgi:hypothetical protein
MRAHLAEPWQLLSPPPIPDQGYDITADWERHPEEEIFHRGLCWRLCGALGVEPVVLEHHRPGPAEAVRVRDMGIIQACIDVMTRHGIPFIPEHWPVTATAGCRCTGLPNPPNCFVVATPSAPPA